MFKVLLNSHIIYLKGSVPEGSLFYEIYFLKYDIRCWQGSLYHFFVGIFNFRKIPFTR